MRMETDQLIRTLAADNAHRARPVGFVLTLSLLAAAVGSAGVVPADAKGAINYGLDNIRFIAPVLAGERVTASFKLTAVEDKGPKGQLLRIAAMLNVEGSDKPALVGEVLALVIG